MSRRYLITGGAGFLGAALARRLIAEGQAVRILDNLSRGCAKRLADVQGEFEFIEGDVREPAVVARAVRGMDVICHLASVNGTEHFYRRPDVVLEVGVKGITHLLEASRQEGIRELILLSSSEVYQEPPRMPADEAVPLSIPDPLNPRYSYAAAKLISEMMALHSGSTYERVVIVRPHNVYGVDMGAEHVIPQFILRLLRCGRKTGDPVDFPIQGSGDETRAFVYLDDFIEGLLLVLKEGAHRGIYHIGTMEEVTVRELATAIGRCLDYSVRVVPGELAAGSPRRRCPDIAKISALGYHPRVSLSEGLPLVVQWYRQQSERRLSV